MAIASITEMQTDMGAAPVCAEKQQISWSQQAVIVGECRNPLAEPLLLIGVSRNSNALAGEGHLHQTGTIHVRLGGSAPQIGIGLLLGGFAPGEHARQPPFNLRRA